ncbi:MAG: hypothetical protein ACTHVE_02295 [Senegalia sp. (in: firmicutes)]|uniref:hypothetical protein n=1 Tax=Senegalia sp. (in: firmicutes) TaxID=1924098 RepID=UPI003F9D35CD
MTRVSSTSRTKRRIHNSFVERNRQVLNTSNIDRVEPASRTENNTSYSNANHLLASDQFYDDLERLKEHYYGFYHSEISLEKEIKLFELNKNYSIYNMKKLLDKYNSALGSLEILDKEFRTSYSLDIKETVKNHSYTLSETGINIINDGKLKLDTNKFIDKIKSMENFDDSINNLKILMKDIYNKFKSIKVPTNNNTNGYDDIEINYSGVLIDEKY